MPDGLLFLTTVDDGFEIGLLEGLLRENGILFVKRHRGAGEAMSIYAGRSVYGVDVFVGERDFERAGGFLEFLKSG